CVGGITGLDYW
nr:immunoglobulin heavy chain junction region [Macaca mulatta]MOW45935.1 immunoglobulin heavy chain junction region [Macaca mulatta]MOW45998.1 immunoglobulin heavy chain junction region [Macaca mulatta]MOW46048.1 immunoglobulin heavy chain junction region [Macaca mulatta]MOW46181.1 immunoglobulin heavy chain junction region [Macaca mulatta]